MPASRSSTTFTAALAIATIALVALGPHCAVAQDDNRIQFWPEVDVYVRTGFDTRLFLFSALTRERPAGTLDAFVAGQFEVGLPPFLRELFSEYDNETQPFDFLRFRVEGLYMRYPGDGPPGDGPPGDGTRGDGTPGEGSPVYEWRGMIEIIPREVFYGSVTFIMRNRLELRWLDGQYSTRIRSRLWVEHTFFSDSDLPITPYINTEFFYDFRYNSFSRLLSQAGLSFGVNSWFAPEIVVGAQRDWVPISTTAYFFGLTATFYF